MHWWLLVVLAITVSCPCCAAAPQALLNIMHELAPADLARLACSSRALWAFANHDELVRLLDPEAASISAAG